MNPTPLIELSSIIVLGITAQWLAWRLKLPSILLLMLFGFIAGPVTGFLHPDLLFGQLYSPFISISLALILFEGGLSLKVADLTGTGSIVRNLLTVGVLATWIIASCAAYFILGLEPLLSVLLGSILVVTGPTVIIPLLLYVRPLGRIGTIVKWEGIMNDPIGAILAIIVLEGILASGPQEAALTAALWFMSTIFIGCCFGFLGAFMLIKIIRNYWAPDRLLEVLSLMFVALIFTASELFKEESGLLAVTLMGVVLANQKKIAIKPIVEFKENLRTLLISILFIVLVSGMQLDYLKYIDTKSVLFLGSLIFVARPVAVLLSTHNSSLSWQEKVFIAWMAPRGIVAAAVSSISGFFLSDQGIPHAEVLAPITFFVVAATVTIYSLTAGPLAMSLQLASRSQKGFLIAGAHPWARNIASVLESHGFPVLLVDTNYTEISKAYDEGLPTYHGSIISESILDEIDISDLGHLLAITSDDTINSLAAIRFMDVFGRKNVYQIRTEVSGFRGIEATAPMHLRGRLLFPALLTFAYIDGRFNSGASLVINEFTENYKYDPSKPFNEANSIPLMLIGSRSVQFFTDDSSPVPMSGQKLVSIHCPKNDHLYE
jgi:NhaP-type Na+/H+ or K+/H+ antiporter